MKIKDFFSRATKTSPATGDVVVQETVVRDATAEDKLKEERGQAEYVKSHYKKCTAGSLGMTFGQDARKSYFCENMDFVLQEVKNEKTKRPYLSRTVHNIVKAALKEGYNFSCEDKSVKHSKITSVKDRFENILYNSNMEPRQFLREVLYNLVTDSNSFCIPKRVERKVGGGKLSNKLERVMVAQNSGWRVRERFGPQPAKWEFIPDDSALDVTGASPKGKEYYPTDIWHFTFNKENDEIFGVPLWVSVIPYLRKFDFLIDETLDSYEDQGIQKTIYSVGTDNSGKRAATVNPETFKEVKNVIEYSGEEDVVVNTPLNVTTLKKDFNSPDKLFEVLFSQVVAGLHTSESQLGGNGAGRQDAETQQDNTNLIVEDFQEALEDWLNITFVREICIELFGNYDPKNRIKFKFNKTFNDQERKEKHSTFLFQSGSIDVDEHRKDIGRSHNQITHNKTFQKLYEQKEVQGAVKSKNSPSNQHTGKSGTGTTRKSKKT